MHVLFFCLGVRLKNPNYKKANSVLLVAGIFLFAGCPWYGDKGVRRNPVLDRPQNIDSSYNGVQQKDNIANAGAVTQRPAVAGTSTDNFFLYEVSMQGKRSFILGTMHAGLPQDYFPAPIFEKFATCKVNLFEADKDAFYQQYGEEYKRRQWLPEGETLAGQLSPGALQHLEQLFPDESVLTDLLKAKPFIVNSEMNNLVKQRLESETHAIWSFDNAIDIRLLKQAKEKNRTIILLDDISHKIDEFENNFTISDLEEKLTRPDPIQDDVECAYIARDAYMSGDLENFNAYYARNCETPAFIQTMITRTQAWIPKLVEAFSQGEACGAFGAAHLPGATGAIQALETHGFQVKRISINDLNSSSPPAITAPGIAKPQ